MSYPFVVGAGGHEPPHCCRRGWPCSHPHLLREEMAMRPPPPTNWASSFSLIVGAGFFTVDDGALEVVNFSM
jgi:hypothetical protein